MKYKTIFIQILILLIFFISSCSTKDKNLDNNRFRSSVEIVKDENYSNEKNFNETSIKNETLYEKAEYIEKFDEYIGYNTKVLRTYYGFKGEKISQIKHREQIILINTVMKRNEPIGMFIWKVNRNGWRYLGCHQVYFLIDNNNFRPRTTHEGNVGNGYVTERITINTEDSQELINLIAESKEHVKFRICNDEFYIPKEYINDYKNFSTSSL